MMKKQFGKRAKLQTLDTNSIDDDGSFHCPNCGNRISPDETESEETYKILESKVIGDELAELVVSCGTCRTVIKVVGVQTLEA